VLREQSTQMLFTVEIRRERGRLSETMSSIREWLDEHRFEPDAFRCTTDEQSITCRLEFKIEREASACAKAFGGRVSSIGDEAVL
jgi:hypothetical protein